MDTDNQANSDSDLSESWSVIDNEIHENESHSLEKEEVEEIGLVGVESSDGESVEVLDLSQTGKIEEDFDEMSIFSEAELEEIDNFIIQDNDYCHECLEIKLKSTHQSSMRPEETDAVDSPNILPVYRHCRNNLVNTMLSTVLGVFLASVAFIALGHFLGVQDANYSAEEMIEILKRLQRENNLLKSKLSNLENMKQEKLVENLEAKDSMETKTKFASKSQLEQLDNFIQNFNNVNGIKETNNNIAKTIHYKLDFVDRNQIDTSGVFNSLDFKLTKSIKKFLLRNKHLNIKLKKFNKFVERLLKFDEKINKKLCNYFKFYVYRLNVNCDTNLLNKNIRLNVFQWYPQQNVGLCKINFVQTNLSLSSEQLENIKKNCFLNGNENNEKVYNTDKSDDQKLDVDYFENLNANEKIDRSGKAYNHDNSKDISENVKYDKPCKICKNDEQNCKKHLKSGSDYKKSKGNEKIDKPDDVYKNDKFNDKNYNKNEKYYRPGKIYKDDKVSDRDYKKNEKYGRPGKIYRNDKVSDRNYKKNEKYGRSGKIYKNDKFNDRNYKKNEKYDRRDTIYKNNKHIDKNYIKNEKYDRPSKIHKNDKQNAKNCNKKRKYDRPNEIYKNDLQHDRNYQKKGKYNGQNNDEKNYSKDIKRKNIYMDKSKQGFENQHFRNKREHNVSGKKNFINKLKEKLNHAQMYLKQKFTNMFDKMKRTGRGWKKNSKENKNEKILDEEKIVKNQCKKDEKKNEMTSERKFEKDEKKNGMTSERKFEKDVRDTSNVTTDKENVSESWTRDNSETEWLFARAKSRSDDRIDNGLWQFHRSYGRQLQRDDAGWWFRRSDARNHYRNDFSSDSFIYI